MNFLELSFFVVVLHISVEATLSKLVEETEKKSRLQTVTRSLDVDEANRGQSIRFDVNKNSNGYRSGIFKVYIGGKWGLVCDEDWNEHDADVACRELGFSLGAKRPIYKGPPYQENWNSLSFVVNNFECQGNEKTLLSCPYRTNTACDISQAVSVTCIMQNQTDLNSITTDRKQAVDFITKRDKRDVYDDYRQIVEKVVAELERSHQNMTAYKCRELYCPKGCVAVDNDLLHIDRLRVACVGIEIKLVNGNSQNTGRVEIIRNGVRGTVCDDLWDDNDATVICRMLGYHKGGRATLSASYGEGSGDILLDDVQCDGTENSIENCSHAGWGVHNCQHSEDAGVQCNLEYQISFWNSTFTPDIEIVLVNGNGQSTGRVEIIRNGVRGTICDDKWDDNDATVICRMLGYHKGGTAVARANYGQGSGEILLDDVKCDGTESSIKDCRHAGWGVHNCEHSEDAGVRCRQESQISGTDDWQSTFSPGCGKRPRKVHFLRIKRQTAKIVYGQSAEYGMYPWQVEVRKVTSYSYVSGLKITTHWCGGTILNKRWILSAAHCFERLFKSRITLRTGDHNNTKFDEYEQEFGVDAIYMHEQYNNVSHDYDVALLKISMNNGEGIRFNDYVQPACLPNMDTPYISGTLCHISGWGKTEHGVSATVLREAIVPLIDDTRCRSLFQNSSITSRMFCAGYEKGRIDTCQGDSGGPLVCEIDGKYTVLGATSWGFGCGRRGYPGVYTHIRNLLPWITDKLKKYN